MMTREQNIQAATEAKLEIVKKLQALMVLNSALKEAIKNQWGDERGVYREQEKCLKEMAELIKQYNKIKQ